MSPFRITRPRFLAVTLFEGGLIFAVLYGLALLTRLLTPGLSPHDPLISVAVTAGLFAVLLLVIQWSSVSDRSGLLRELVLFAVISFVLSMLSFGALWFYHGGLDRTLGRLDAILFLEGAVAVPASLALWRWISTHFKVFEGLREKILIVGTGETARQVCRWILSDHSREYAVVGFADESQDRLGSILAMGARIQTDYRSLPSCAPRRGDRVIVAIDEKRGKFPVRQLMELRLLGVEIEDATTFFERISGKIAVETMLPSWLIFSEGFKSSPVRSALKRTADLLSAFLLLVIASPLMLLCALLILLFHGRPVLYRQSRLGREGREFNVLKFRSMNNDAEARSGPIWAARNDPRVTTVGKVIRKLRIDELPQLFNVIRGEMSFVGPRPERGHFVRQLEQRIPYYGLRMTVRPGLTGWAQVEYGYGATEDETLEKLKYDLYYIKNNNVFLDLWIILKTIKVVLLGSGAR